MSTITETLHKEEALFIPGEDTTNGTTTEYTPKVAGEYLGHITELETDIHEFDEKDRTGKPTGRRLKARFFNYTIRVAPETADLTFTRHDAQGNKHTHNGRDYIGWEVRGGVPRFLEPQTGDTFDAHPEGNDSFMRLCGTVGIELKTEPREVGGKTLNVQILPTLKREDVIGIPVIAVVDLDKKRPSWVNKDGDTVPSWKVMFVKTWKDGVRLDDDLPF